jgi:translation initiation factor 2 beta subunit (eIF-2beta)/eIF-5
MMRYSKLDQMIKEAALQLFTEQQNSEKPKEEKSAYEKTIEKYDEKKAKEKEAKEKKAKEKKKGKDKIVVTGAYGTGGRFKMEAAANRAQRDPEGLMKDLKVTAATGATDLEKAASVLSQAIRGNEVMSSAFSMPATKTVGEAKQVVITPKSNELSQRNATKFLYFTLQAAENSGVLRLKDGIKFANAANVSVPTIIAL